MFSLFVLSTLFLFASAADEKKENNFVSQISKVISAETTKGASELAAFWDKKEKTDQESIGEFLKGVETEVFQKLKKGVVGLVMNSLGKVVIKPESSDMFRVLKEIVTSFIREITLGRARTLSKNKDIKYDVSTKGNVNKLSQSIANFYDGIMKKNATEGEKSQLIGKSQQQIDNFIKLTIQADDKKNSKTASRSGGFLFNHNLMQQQQQSSSSVAQKLTNEISTSLCAPQTNYLPQASTNCHVVCHPQCTQCNSGLGANINYDNRHNSYGLHQTSGLASGAVRYGDLGYNTLVGSGYTNPGHVGRRNYAGSLQSSHNSHSFDASISGSSGSSGSNLGVYGTQGNSGSHLGLYGSIGNSLSDFQGSSSGSHLGVYGSQGTGMGDLKGSHSGIANLWSLKPARNDGVSYGSSSLGGSSLGGSSIYGGSSYSGGLLSNHHQIGGLGNANTYGHQVGNLGAAAGHSVYSSSKSSSSSKSDSSASQMSYGSSGNIW